MPMISFSGITEAGPFYKQIREKRKTQTIRDPRKDGRPHCKIGDDVNLYWKVRTPKDKKPIHFIATVNCKAYEPVTLIELWDDEKNALADGFSNLNEFRDWFLPEWRNSKVKRIIEILREYAMDKQVMVYTARRLGKTLMMEVVEELTRKRYRIKWKINTCWDCKHCIEQHDDDYGPALPWSWKCNLRKGYKTGKESACREFDGR